jgi:hypothetical protein
LIAKNCLNLTRWVRETPGNGQVIEAQSKLRCDRRESDTDRGMGKPKLPRNLQDWADARKRFRLSDAHVQMARELGMNPRKLGKLDNHDQEPWKAPLPEFIEQLYLRSFGRERPEVVMSLEERARARQAKKRHVRKRGAPRGERIVLREAGHERVPVLRVPGDRPAAV